MNSSASQEHDMYITPFSSEMQARGAECQIYHVPRKKPHADFVRNSLQMNACALGLSENHACHTRFSDGAPKECGVGEERRSRSSRVALNHATKDLNSTMYALAGSAPGHMMLLPPIHIPQAPLPLCTHPYSDPTRLVLRGPGPWPGGQRL